MGEQVVGFEILVDLDEMEVAAWLFTCSGGAGFAVADDLAAIGDPIGLGEWAEREDHAGGVAAGIGDEAGLGDFVGVKFGQAVDSLAEPVGVRGGQLVPPFKRFGGAEAESSA